MNKLLAETDPKKLLELKKNYPNLTHSIYEIPETNRSLILNHIKRFSKLLDQILSIQIQKKLFLKQLGVQ